jgi:multidrug efflux pump subunit AcrA (membrane-fusion protein)
MQKNNAEKTLEVQLPRREEMLKESAVKAAIEREKIKSTAALNIDQKRLALKKEQFDLTKTREKLEELEKDRALFEVKAPTDGVVYYGQAEDGQWSGVAVEAKKLDPGGKVQAGEVFVTVVQPRPMWVRVKVDEKELFKLSGKPKGEVSPNGFPEVALEAQVESVSAVPLAPGVFEAQVEVELTDESEMLMPGMACEFLMAQTLAEDVLTLPKSVVFRDGPGAAWHVYRPGKDGEKAEKVDVKLGKRGSDKVQVVEGLKEGDEVLTSKPE